MDGIGRASIPFLTGYLIEMSLSVSLGDLKEPKPSLLIVFNSVYQPFAFHYPYPQTAMYSTLQSEQRRKR